MKYILLLALSFLSITSWAQSAKNETTSAQVIKIGDAPLLVVTINHDTGWHTYWKNPGDSGIASQFKFNFGDKEQVLEPMNGQYQKNILKPVISSQLVMKIFNTSFLKFLQPF